MILREYQPQDCPALVQLFKDTVFTINKQHYSPAQLTAWAGNVTPDDWAQSLLNNTTVVAQCGNSIAGFGDLEGNTINRLYIHKNFQRQGIAKAILLYLEEIALLRGTTELTTYASITAKPFFEKMGYTTQYEQQVERKGILLTNYAMHKNLQQD